MTTESEIIKAISDAIELVEIIDVVFESRSIHSETVNIFFNYDGVSIENPFTEEIDNGVITLYQGGMCDLFATGGDFDEFVSLKAVAIKAQDYINEYPECLKGLLTKDSMEKVCDEHGVTLKEMSAGSLKHWKLYSKKPPELLNEFLSLASVLTAINNAEHVGFNQKILA